MYLNVREIGCMSTIVVLVKVLVELMPYCVLTEVERLNLLYLWSIVLSLLYIACAKLGPWNMQALISFVCAYLAILYD